MHAALRNQLAGEPIAQLRAFDPLADAGHAVRVADLSLRIAAVFGEPVQPHDLYLAACLHDLGKAELHHLVQLPRPLTQEERQCMESHATCGAVMAQTLLGVSDTVKAYVLHHHEQWGVRVPTGPSRGGHSPRSPDYRDRGHLRRVGQ
ncbi:HD-GYP domain-containing protein [Deinococcus multiflagellatus]|uniref:HD-GYP domain-containing protein n=1 Tax=Deinococcus multiflagellatus TaxID=1656887 RepID=A0ABW1ZQA5_9DEIO